MKKFIVLLLLFGSAANLMPLANTQQDPGKPRFAHGRGHKPAKNLAELKAASAAAHRHRLKALPKITAPTWDCRTLGLVPPIVDQGQCGSCWDFSGTSVVTSALIKAGYGKPDGSFALSEQYTLDCGSNGGCSGDDNVTVLTWAKTTGLPTTAAYGPYIAQAQGCKYAASMTLYKLADWGFCTTSDTNAVATTQDIKNAMVAYGPIGAAIAADNAFESNPAGQVFQGSGSTDINHDIVLCGWDDSKGAWLLRNSWGTSWCDAGYCWIKYGANAVGTEAVWASATALPPPPAPVPPAPPPGPTPPGPVPSPSTTLTISAPLAAGSYEVATAGTQAAIDKITADVVALQALSQAGMPPAWREPPLIKPASPSDKRLDAMESNMMRLTESILNLQKLIGGQPK